MQGMLYFTMPSHHTVYSTYSSLGLTCQMLISTFFPYDVSLSTSSLFLGVCSWWYYYRLWFDSGVGSCDILQCICDGMEVGRYVKLFVVYPSLYTRRVILFYRKLPNPPTFSAWCASVNTILPLYQLNYMSRSCQRKSDTVWNAWYVILIYAFAFITSILPQWGSM